MWSFLTSSVDSAYAPPPPNNTAVLLVFENELGHQRSGISFFPDDYTSEDIIGEAARLCTLLDSGEL